MRLPDNRTERATEPVTDDPIALAGLRLAGLRIVPGYLEREAQEALLAAIREVIVPDPLVPAGLRGGAGAGRGGAARLPRRRPHHPGNLDPARGGRSDQPDATPGEPGGVRACDGVTCPRPLSPRSDR